jgi:hydrocephalus-inducing protein
VLHNPSSLPAKFEVVPQDEATQAFGDIEPDQASGSVPPASSHVLTITLTSRKIGPIRIPLYIRILGHNVPYPITLTATSIGPRVHVDKQLLDYGPCKCLQPETRSLRITNDSSIDAAIRVFMKSKNSVWTVHTKMIHLTPQETCNLDITLVADETVKMSDVVHLVVQEGNDLAVNVRARGIGTPVTAPEPLDLIDFGTQYTTRTITRKYVVENRGRKPRKLQWQIVKDSGKKK